MSFSTLALLTGLACGGLGLGFLFSPPGMLRPWGLSAAPASSLLSRRIGAVYLGLALLLVLGRGAPPSDLRTAVSACFALSTALLAALGLFELRSGNASRGILVAVGVETAMALGFTFVMLAGSL